MNTLKIYMATVSGADDVDLAQELRKRADVLDPPEPPREWDVMIDLETYGTRPGCAVRSIGAVCFDPNTDELGTEFYDDVFGGQSELKYEAETVKWRGTIEPSGDWCIKATTLGQVAQNFREWFHSISGRNVWAHGSAIIPAWDVASTSAGVNVPWMQSAVRDTRTLYALAEFTQHPTTRGAEPYALHTARHQAMCVQAAVKKLRSPWGPVCAPYRWG